MKYDLSKYDFLDLGCKNGGSLKYCAKRFRTGKTEAEYAKGIGIDINPKAVEKARKNGFDALEQDILKLKLKHKFRFVSAMDFLEHMPGVKGAEAIVTKMAELAEDFLYIRHPSFEDVEYLKQLGLKLAWTDWSVHTAPVKIYDYAEMFNRLGLKQYCFQYKDDVIDSSNKFILPLDAPQNTLEYRKDLGKKPKVKFDKKVFTRIDIFVALRPLEPKIWNWITRED